jgi:hypothetical protein
VLGATWSQHGVIVISQGRELYKVADRGGVPELLHRGPGIPYDPEFLPDGEHFLFRDAGTILVGSLDDSSPATLLQGATLAHYAAGHILFTQQGRLMAQGFDTKTLGLTGRFAPIANEYVLAFSAADARSRTRPRAWSSWPGKIGRAR